MLVNREAEERLVVVRSKSAVFGGYFAAFEVLRKSYNQTKSNYVYA